MRHLTWTIGAGLMLLGLIACKVPKRHGLVDPKVVKKADPSADLLVTGPWLMFLGNGRIGVAMEGEFSKPPIVEWWKTGAPGPLRAGEGRGIAHPVECERHLDLWVAILESLPLDTELAYHVVTERGTSVVYDFRAGASRGQPIRIAAFGDTRSGHQVHRKVVESMARERFEFVIHTGDMVENGGLVREWRRFFRIERPLLGRRPFIGAIGNHDTSSSGFFRRFFLLDYHSTEDRYFKLDWGDVRVVAIDTEVETREGSSQFEFVEAALREGARNGQLLIVTMHKPPYSSGEHGNYGKAKEVLDELGPKYGVELVIAGHDHNYERSKPIEGVTYLVAGSSGAPIRRVRPRDWSASVRTEPHFVLLDIERGGIVLRAVNLYGRTFDTAVLEPNPPRVEL